MREEWRWFTVQQLQDDGILLVEDGNHGEHRPRASEFVEDGVAKFVRATDMTDGRILFDAANSISDVALARIRKGIGLPGDILFSHKGTVGKLAVAPNDAEAFVCSPQTTFWRVLQPLVLDPGFLYTFMRSPLFVRQWHVRKGETDMADYVSLTAQRRLKVPVPEYREQRQLAAATSALDRSIENNRRRIEILEEMARLIYREWFVHFRFPGHEDVELVASDLGPIPEAWEVATLGSVASINETSLRTGDDVGEILYVDISSVGSRTMDPPEAMEFSDAPGRARRLVAAGDTIWSTVRPNRRSHALLVDPPPNMVCSTGFAVLTPKVVPSSLLFEMTSSDEFTAHLSGLATGSAYPAVRPPDFERFAFALPPSELREQFDRAVGPMHQLQHTLSEQNFVLTEARDLLLPRLISGELDVSGLDLDLESVA